MSSGTSSRPKNLLMSLLGWYEGTVITTPGCRIVIASASYARQDWPMPRDAYFLNDRSLVPLYLDLFIRLYSVGTS